MIQCSWDELRRQAKALENELDGKLAAFGTLSLRPDAVGSSAHQSSQSSSHFIVSGLNTPDGSFKIPNTREESFQSHTRMVSEIEQLLQRLTTINDQMSMFVRDVDNNSTGAALGDGSMRPPSTIPTGQAPGVTSLTAGQLTQLHTVKRHREILRDYAQEFRQTRAKIIAAREREDLLSSVYRDISNRDSIESTDSSGNQRGTSLHSHSSSATRLLLDEQEKYHRSNRMMDDHLAAASTIRVALRAQRMALRNASSGLHSLATRFPRIKQLIGKIDWRHRKDSIVLGLVIAFCVAFLIIYKLS
ncbi:Golgi SNAP receptor complex member 1 [Clonorchis sinensis]|uniref:Golgi SNAP receptor complex member 1 n=2 Tax=Clonorchis sinensis TaxID=79923 RepID=A0A3R7GTM5_CLOSI|nr:Golgi SNAP receptor complex member 1 [Clonorchis sinensis]